MVGFSLFNYQHLKLLQCYIFCAICVVISMCDTLVDGREK